MKIFLQGAVLTTAILGALALPTNLNSTQEVQKEEAQHKQSLLGTEVEYNLSKQSNLVPAPNFLNVNANYEEGAGSNTKVIMPFLGPLGLFLPPLNLSFGINANKNVSVGLNAVSQPATEVVEIGVGPNGFISEIDVSVGKPVAPPPNPPPNGNGGGWGWTEGNAWGWITTPAPAGWGWQPTEGWSKPTEGWTTPGWAPTEGWTTPPPAGWAPTEGWTTPGWAPTEGWTTPGWAPTEGWTTPGWAPTQGWTTPGWAPGWKSPESAKDAETRKVPGNIPAKPAPPNSLPSSDKDKPKPQLSGKPIPQIGENIQASPDKENGNEPTFISDVAQSTLQSELPSIADVAIAEQAAAAAPLGEDAITIAAAAAQATAHHENELNADSHPYFAIVEVDSNPVFIPESPVSQDSIPSELSQSIAEASEAVSHDASGAENSVQTVAENLIPQQSVRISVPIAPVISNKARRHVGVEIPATLRIEDFDDVEAAQELSPLPERENEGLVAHEQKEPNSESEGDELSKEEMILMAMEQLSTQLPSGVQLNQLNIGRPSLSASRPNIFNRPPSNVQTQTQSTSVNRPDPERLPGENHGEFSEGDFSEREEDSSEESSEEEVDEKNVEKEQEPAEEKPVVSKSPPKQTEASPEKPGKNKPRPYGMDRPSKNKPHSESGNKHEQFGLPHHTQDFQQKGTEGESTSTTVMGFQIPNLKWSSFSDIFQHFMGSRHKKNGQAKSDDAVLVSEEKCVEDENEVTKSHAIHAGGLCTNSLKGVQCNDACKSKGFSSGTCLGPASTPGCLCKLPNHKEYGMMLNPLKTEASEEKDLQQSVASPCKKCECEDSCKKSGSFTGFCVDKCYCANPWYTKL